MAIAVVYSSASALTGSGPYTETINVNNATLLIVGLSWATGTTPTVTFGGVAMNLVSGTQITNTVDATSMAIFELVNPANGSQVLSVSGVQQINAASIGFTGQGSPYLGDVRVAGGDQQGTGTLSFNASATNSYLIAFEGCFFSGSQQQSITAGWSTLATNTTIGDIRMYGQSAPSVGSNPFTFTAFAGDYVNLNGVEILGTAGPKTITINPSTATFGLPPLTVQYDQTVSINNAVVAHFAPGALTVALVNTIEVTVANDIQSIFALGPALVSAAHPPGVTLAPLPLSFALGPVNVAIDKKIIADPLVFVAEIGLSFTSSPASQTIPLITPRMRITLGPVAVSQPKFLTIAPLSAIFSTGPVNFASGYTINARALPLAVGVGAFSIAVQPAPALTVAPLPLHFATGPVTVAPGTPPAVTAAPQTATFSTVPITVSVPAPHVITVDTAVAAFSLPTNATLAFIQNLRILADTLQMRVYSTPFSISNYSYQVQSHDTGVFQITLDAPAIEEVVVNWFTANDSAIAGVDYTAASGQAIIPVGQQSTNITVKFAEPAAGAPAKDFIVYLSSPTNAILGKNFGYCFIPAGTPVTSSAPSFPALSISSGVISVGSIVVPPLPGTIQAAPLTVSVSAGAATISQAGVTPPPVQAALTPLTAVGSKLFDQAGVQYIPRTCHWYGFDSNGVPGGLWARAWKTFTDTNGVVQLGLLDQVKAMGFNGIRLSFCQNITWGKTTMDPTSWTPDTGMTPNDSFYGTGYVSPTLNPDLFKGGGTYASPQTDLITCLEIMDKIVNYCGQLGLRIILDMHVLSWSNSDQRGNSRATAPNSTGQLDYSTNNPLGEANWIYTKRWYTTTNPGDAGMNGNVVNEYRNEAQAIAAWVALAARYEGNAAVMGCDLINEPAGTTWDDDPHTGLPAFFERCGAAIMAVNSDLMIVCEAPAGNIDLGPQTIDQYGNTVDFIMGAQFSGNFTGARSRPVVLKKNGVVVTGKVMYSPHHYGSYAAGGDGYAFLSAAQKSLWNNPIDKVFGNQYCYDENFPENLPGIIRQMWGFLAEDNIAPVWIGEMGGSFAPVQLETTVPIEQFPNYTTYNAQSDIAWITMLDRYMRAYDVGHSWFSLNAEPSGAAYGILGVDSAGAFTTDINSFQKPYVDMCLSPTPLNPPLLRRLKTSGKHIVDDRGNVVRLKSQNWWGMELQLVPEMLAQNSFNGPGRAFRTITYTGVTTTNESGSPAIVSGTSDTPLYTHGQVFEGVIAQLKREGYNCIRVPLCEDVTWPFALPYPGTNINGILNPQLCSDGGAAGMYDVNMRPAIEILDQIVAECHRQGMYIFVDLHSVAPENPSEGNDIHADGGLWYTTATPTTAGTGVTQTAAHIGKYDEKRNEAQAMAFHTFLAARYSSRWPCFAGIDLINEPSNGTWDLDPNTGLVGYYNRAIAAIRAVEPDWHCLVICEGTSGPVILNNGTDYEYPALAGNLSGVATLQVTDPVPNKVVYSTHEYQTFNTPRFLSTSFPATLPPYWDAVWGFILTQNIAPVLIGEFGADLRDPTKLSTTDTSGGNGSPAAQSAKGRQWMNALASYVNSTGASGGASWSYWAIVVFNPTDYSVGYGNFSGPWIGYDQTTDDPDTKPYLAPFLAG